MQRMLILIFSLLVMDGYTQTTDVSGLLKALTKKLDTELLSISTRLAEIETKQSTLEKTMQDRLSITDSALSTVIKILTDQGNSTSQVVDIGKDVLMIKETIKDTKKLAENCASADLFTDLNRRITLLQEASTENKKLNVQSYNCCSAARMDQMQNFQVLLNQTKASQVCVVEQTTDTTTKRPSTTPATDAPTTTKASTTPIPIPEDCKSVAGREETNIQPNGSKPVSVSCIDGWTSLLMRDTGALTFDRTRPEYSKGFGSADSEHFIGLENIRRMTFGKASCKLRINLKLDDKAVWNSAIYRSYPEDGDGKLKTVELEDFTVGSAPEFSAQFHGNFTTNFRNDRGSYILDDWRKEVVFATGDFRSEADCARYWATGWWFVSRCHTDRYRKFDGFGQCSQGNRVCFRFWNYLLSEIQLLLMCT